MLLVSPQRSLTRHDGWPSTQLRKGLRVFLHRSFVPGLAIYSYVVGDEASGRCAVIDPTRDVEPYMRLAREQGLPAVYS